MMTEQDMKRIQDQLDSVHNFGEWVGKISRTVFLFITKHIWKILILLGFGVIMIVGGIVKGVEEK